MVITDQNSAEQDEAEIRELIERWSKAVRDEDFEKISADHDPDILMFDVPPPLQVKGLDAYMSTWELFFTGSVKPVEFDFHEVNVTAGADVAFATAIGRCRSKEPDGNFAELEFRLTMGLRKRSGRWRIVHEHHSVPSVD